MAKIKGITIEIGGNTQPLNKALSDVNKKSKDLQSELRQVEKLLKLDPKNTELLAQKQKLLADAVENSREKLDRLKTAQEQVNEQFAKGEISKEQYRAFQREVVKAEQDLSKFERQLSATVKTTETWQQKLDKASNSLKNAGSKMKSVGQDLTMKLTVPVVGLGAVITKTGMDFEAAMSQVGAISGATGEDLQKLEDIAKKMGATTKFSASQAAEGLKYMAMAGWGVEQQLAALPGLLSLAAAAGEELGLVSDIVTDAMTAFGIEAARAGEFADIIAAASSNANTNVAMMGETFQYVAPLFGALGYTAQDAALAVGLMANAGIKSSQAGTSLRGAISRLVKPVGQAKGAIAELGLVITDAEGLMLPFRDVMVQLREKFSTLTAEQQAQNAALIFGQEAMSGMLAIINASDADFNKLAGAIDNSAGAADRMATEMQDNVKGKLITLKSAIEGVALQLYELLIPSLEKVFGFAQKLVDGFAGLSSESQKMILIVAGLAAAIGPLLLTMGIMAGSIGAIAGALPALQVAFAAITGPIGLVVAAIAAVAAGLVYLYKTNEDVRKNIQIIWGGIKKIIETVMPAILFIIKAVWGNIQGVINGVLTVIQGLISVFAGILTLDFSKMWEGIKQIFSGAFEFIFNLVQLLFIGKLLGIFKNFAQLGLGVIRNFGSNIIKAFQGFKDGVIQAGRSLIQGLWEGIQSMGSWLYQQISLFLKDNVIGIVKKVLGIASPSKVMAEFGRHVAEGLAQGIEQGSGEVAKKAQQMAQAISNAVQKMTGELSNALNLSNARLALQKELLGNNAEEAEKLALELKKLNSEKDHLIKKIDILSAAYETSKEKLGENNETTKQYAYELEMAQIELQKMEASIKKTNLAIDEQKQKAIEAAKAQAKELRSLADEVAKVEKKYRQDLAEAAKDYQSKIEEVNRKLIEDERSVTQEYQNQINSRAKTLRDFVGLFGAVSDERISGRELLLNLQGQVKAFEDWQKNIAELAARGVDEGLIEELREMGPKAGPQIAALNNLTDEQLTQYVTLWKEKNKLARQEAVNQLQDQKAEMQQKLEEIRLAAAEQLEAYRVEWEKKNAEIRKNAEAELTKIQDKFNETAEAGTKQGMKLILNFAQGMESQFDRLRQAVEEARAIAGELDPTVRHSPSLVDNVKSGLAEIYAAYQDLARKIQNINLGSVSMPALAGASGSVVYTYNNDNRVINITVQDGEDLLRTLHRLGVRLP